MVRHMFCMVRHISRIKCTESGFLFSLAYFMIFTYVQFNNNSWIENILTVKQSNTNLLH